MYEKVEIESELNIKEERVSEERVSKGREIGATEEKSSMWEIQGSV